MIRKDKCSFSLLVDRESEQDMFAAEKALNGMLERYGIRVTCSPSRYQGRKGLVRYSFAVRLDRKTAARGAGRKPAASRLSMEEALRLESDGMAKSEIAGHMGVSLATYYRKRKAYLEGSES